MGLRKHDICFPLVIPQDSARRLGFVIRAVVAQFSLMNLSWEVPVQVCAKCWVDNLVFALAADYQLPSITPQ